MPLAYFNGEYLPDAAAQIGFAEPLLAGVAVVDNCRIWHGKLFRWADHQARLRQDAEHCHITFEKSDAEITAIAERILPSSDVHLITVVSPGVFLMHTRPVDEERNRRWVEKGVRLRVAGVQPVSGEALLPATVKHRSRLLWHVAQSRVLSDELAVLLDSPGGSLTETAVACVWAVIDDQLVTPPRDMALDSIAGRVVRELAASFHWPVIERPICETDWRRASELFLAGSGFGIAPVVRINDHEWPGAGRRTTMLIAEWSRLVSQ